MIPEEFKVKAEKTIEMLKDYKKAEILLIHHDDADGLCSATDSSRGFLLLPNGKTTLTNFPAGSLISP